MHDSPRTLLRPVSSVRMLFLAAIATVAPLVGDALVFADPPPEPVPAENPLRTADESVRAAARSAAWTNYQRACRPCHGTTGAGDGPFAASFPKKASDLRHPSREIAADATRFLRIRDGAATLGDRAWESNMPAFGGELDAQAIWGLVALLEDLAKDGTGIDVDASGAEIYGARCAACHGADGRGDGPLAAELMPPPRNFVHGSYRIRSTEYGAAPLPADIMGATARGLGSTSMGRFLLGIDRGEALTKHVMSFSPKLFETEPNALTGSTPPALAPLQAAARGRVVYEEAKCGECHGAEGRGDGPSGLTLKDDENHPSIPTNLTMRWKIKIGSSANDVFRTLRAGLNGTAMKSYETTLSSDDRWALAYYIERIARLRPRYAPTIHAALVTEALPLDPDDAFWKPMLLGTVAMGPQVEVPPYWTQPAVEVVNVAVAANKDEIGVLLVWDDRSRDVRDDEAPASSVAAALARYGSWKLPDAIAVEFPEPLDAKRDLPPSFFGAPQHGVRRWQWSAARQERGEATASVSTFTGPSSTPVANGDAVRTAATYRAGQWRVLLIGKRPPKTVTKLPIALQAWDGGSGEAGNWQSFSAWVNVDLQ